MKVKNISSNMLVLAAVKIQPNTLKSLDTDFGGDFSFNAFKDEFISAFSNNFVEFYDNNGELINDIGTVIKYFQNISSITNINNTTNTTNNNISQNISTSEDFYYNFKTFSMEYGEIKNFTFEGYLKTLDIYAKSGDIDIQIIDPAMNKISVLETSNYTIDCDYKIKNPVIKITCKRTAEVTLYIDGIFFNSNKTKEQYLSEIYSDSAFPETSEINSNSLIFKTNFKKPMKSDKFLDIINNYVGSTYNNSNLLSFNKFEDGAYVVFGDINKLTAKDNFTFNIWINCIGDIISKQTFYSKSGNLEITIENAIIYCIIGNKIVQLNNMVVNEWVMLSISKNGKNYSFYINDTLVNTLYIDAVFSNCFEYVYIGSKYSNTQNIRSGMIGECAIYNYHFSQGLIKYLYMNNHPDLQIQTNLISGSYKSKYKNLSSVIPLSPYDFTIIEKENTKIPNLINTTVTNMLSDSNNEGELTIFSGKIYISEDGKYNFAFSGMNHFILTIDDKPVLLNDVSNTIYLEEGYYRFKLSVIDKGEFDLTYSVNDLPYTYPSLYIEDFNDSSGVDYSVFFDYDNKQSNYNLKFDSHGLSFVENDVSVISGIQTLINNNIFNISFNIMLQDAMSTIFGQGLTWEPNFELRANDSKLIFTHQGVILTSPKLKVGNFYNIQITANGSNIYFYIDGKLITNGSVNKISRLDSTDNLYIGRMGQNYAATWMDGRFRLQNFKWYLKYFTESEVINNYINVKAV